MTSTLATTSKNASNGVKKKVLLATRPLTPPWDEASKNFAYFLGKSITRHRLTLLGTDTSLPDLPEHSSVVPLYRGAHLNLVNKLRLLWFLHRHSKAFDVIHYLFTPTKQNAKLITQFALPKSPTKTLQTVATVRDDLYTPETLRRVFFADALVTYTDTAKAKLETLGCRNVSRIYPGIDLEHFSPGEKNTDLLRTFGCTKEHFLVVYPGEYTRLGVTDLLTEMWLQYFQTNPETTLRFVFACRVKNEADQEKKVSIQKRFTEAGLSQYVIFSDTITDMPTLYRTADLVIFPVTDLAGKFDVPLIIIEAYACKAPVILSDLKAFSEFSNESFCATVETGSAPQLLEKILYLKENEVIRVGLAEEARRFVEKNFDLRETARLYSELYDAL